MSHRSAHILEDALSLTAAERIALVESLLASLDCAARREVDQLLIVSTPSRVNLLPEPFATSFVDDFA